MKVLYITHVTDLAGANRSMLQLIKELKENYDVEPFVLYPKIYQNNKTNIKTELDKLGISSLSHKLTSFKKRDNYGIVDKIRFALLNTLIVLHLLWILRKKQFDIVHSNSSVIDTGAYLSFFKSIPHVWHLREFGQKDFNLISCLGKKYEKWIYSQCSKFIAISKAVKNEFKSIIPETKISLIYNGILPPDCKFKSAHNSKKMQFCIVGRVENNKNQMEALEACNLLKNEGYEDFHLTIIGQPNEIYLNLLNKYINDNHLEHFVDILRQRYDIYKLLSKMDVGLMLSKYEAFGRVTIEYMMHNLAVIASNTGANPELIIDKKTGLLYSVGDPIELMSKMKYLINNKKNMLQMAMAGQEEAINRFSSNINTSSIYKVYGEVINKL